jgi:Ca2+-binding EF-hand superfamily protein
MGRSFRIMDDNGDRKIDKQEFYWGLKDLGAEVSKREAQLLLEYLDTNKDGVVSYDEFLFGIRGMPNETRQEIIDVCFAKFDADGNGTVTSADLRTVYDCSNHPKVISGEMTPEEVFVQFLASFGDRNGDGIITHVEWNDYYAAVSANIDNDNHFVQLMRNAWKLDQ